MGHNTTVVVMNDSLDAIKADSEFGKNLAAAISRRCCTDEPIDVSAGYHCNAASVIETHHADGTAIVAVGGNYGKNLGIVFPYGDEEEDVRILKALAYRLGYRVSRKPKRKQ